MLRFGSACFVYSALTIFALTARVDSADVESAAEDVFNGRDLSGWVVEGTADRKNGDETVPIWTAADGEVHCAGTGFGFLRLDRKICDFVFQAEYRLGARGNSGIGIRTVPFQGAAATRPSFAAYEIQLLDDAGRKPNAHTTGSLYRYVAAKKNASKPAGEWNTIEIDCRGPRIKITINGEVVQDIDQTTVKEIKDKPLCGSICLQNHGSEVTFRNLKLRTIKAAE